MSKCMRVGWLVCVGVMSSCVNRDNGVSFTCLVYCTLSKVSILSSAYHYYTVLTPCFLFNNIVVRVDPRVFSQLYCQVHVKCISSVCQCMSSVCQVHVKYISSVCQLVSIKCQYDGGTKFQLITHARVVCRTRISLTLCHTFHLSIIWPITVD